MNYDKTSLAANHWQRLSQIDQWLAQLQEMASDAERHRWLTELASSDPDAVAVLQRMLNQSTQHAEPLTPVAALRLTPDWREDMGQEGDQAAERRPGDLIGNYQLISKLGVGGMGEVWRAQKHSQVGLNKAGINKAMPVAIKLIKSHYRQSSLRERLLRERDLLQRLVHPNIARLLDSGVSERAEVYLVIELVDGMALLSYAEQQQLSSRQRIELMLPIVEAVAAAQAQLIVHRDIKPANLMVSHDGTPKLLDFGIAKLLDDSGVGNATELTQQLGRALTPAYAAPEQMRGEPVSTATDVYALGVVLQELLIGVRPQPRLADQELLLASKLAKAAGKSMQARALQGDLDCILQKAMAPKAADRYINAQALMQDLQAYLQKRPISARATHWYERLAKLMLRHKVASAALAIAALALTIGASVAYMQYRQAQQSAAEARYVQQFLERIFAQNEPGLPREQLPSTAELLQKASQEALQDTSAPAASRVALLFAIASIQNGQRASADALKSVDAAIAIAPSADLAPWQLPALQAWRDNLYMLQDPAQAEPAKIINALQNLHRLGAPANWLLRINSGLVSLLDQKNQRELAQQYALQALNVLHATDVTREQRLDALSAAVTALSSDQEYRPQAETLARQALATAQQYFGAEHAQTAYAEMRLGSVLRIKGDLLAAKLATEQAGANARRVYPPDHPQLARILEEQARVSGRLNEREKAVDLWREIVNIRVKNYGADSEYVWRSKAFLTQALSAAEQYAEAADLGEQSCLGFRALVPASNPSYLDACDYAANALIENGAAARAISLLPNLDAAAPAELAASERWRFFSLLMNRLRAQYDHASFKLLQRRLLQEVPASRSRTMLLLRMVGIALQHRPPASAQVAPAIAQASAQVAPAVAQTSAQVAPAVAQARAQVAQAVAQASAATAEQELDPSIAALMQAANDYIAIDDSNRHSEIANLLTLLWKHPEQRQQIQSARDVLLARRGKNFFAVRVAAQYLQPAN